MRTHSTLLALFLAPLAYLACNQDADVGAVDDAGSITTPGSDAGTSGANANGDANTTPDGAADLPDAADSASPALTDFVTEHPYVGCSEIGEDAAGEILVAGTKGATILEAAGTTKLAFADQGFLLPVQYTSETYNYVFGRFQLDGLHGGFYGIAVAQGPANLQKQVFRYDLTGAAAAGFTAPALAGATVGYLTAREPALADEAGVLHVVYGNAGQGAASWGAKRVDQTGAVTTYSHDTVGATLETVGPFSSVLAFASAGTDHYVHGVAKADSVASVYEIAQDGTASAAFTRVVAPETSRIRVGSTALFVVESSRVTAFSRTTGAALTTFTGGGGAPGELTLNQANVLWGAGVDEQDRLYLVQGHLMTRYLASGAVDASFGPVELNSIPTQGSDQLAVVGFGPSRVLVSHCRTSGSESTQTTYGFAR